ncbi:MAG: formyltransferase family protein [Formosimonas sp.]
MRVVIIGQKWLAEQLLRMCQSRGDDIAAVIVPNNADRLSQAAARDGIHVTAAQRVELQHIPAGVDVILCAHNHAFVTAEARAKARLGALGYHPSLLPRHRGRDAIRWAIHMNDQVTGGTVYWLDDGADTGPIAAQEWCWVNKNDTEKTLWRDTLAPIGLRLFDKVLTSIDNGVIPAHAQDESQATFEPAFKKAHLNVI